MKISLKAMPANVVSCLMKISLKLLLLYNLSYITKVGWGLMKFSLNIYVYLLLKSWQYNYKNKIKLFKIIIKIIKVFYNYKNKINILFEIYNKYI